MSPSLRRSAVIFFSWLLVTGLLFPYVAVASVGVREGYSGRAGAFVADCALALVRSRAPWYVKLGAWAFPLFAATYLGAYLERRPRGLAFTLTVTVTLTLLALVLTVLAVRV